MSRTPRPHLWLISAALLVSAAACGTSGGQVAKSNSREVPVADSTSTPPPDDIAPSREIPGRTTTTIAATATTTADPACRPGPGKQVQNLPDLEIAAFHANAFDSPDQRLGKVTVPGVHVSAIDLPAQKVEGGCIVRYDAPAGCLGRVTISAATMAGRSIPGASIPAVKVGPTTLFEADSRPGDSVPGDQVKGDDVAQACRVTSTGTYKAAVGRAAASRAALARGAVSRPALTRPAICLPVNGKKECTDSVYVDSVYVDSEYMDSVYVDSEYLPSEYLDNAPGTEVLTGKDTKAYVTPAAVLFDFDKSDLLPAAIPSLQAIAVQLQNLPAGAKIQVDGHTDDQGSDAYNDQLSQARADAVAAWLSGPGGVAAERISTKGYGEKVPVGPNDTEEHRAENRRVVISVTNG